VDENLEATGLVDGGVKKSQKTLRWVSGCSILFQREFCPFSFSGDVESYLVSNIRASFADITVHLAHDTNVLIAVQQRELLILGATTAAGNRLVGLQTGIGEDHDQTLSVLVMGWNRSMLLSNELRQLWRRTGLGP
jgi:hypothetical protein